MRAGSRRLLQSRNYSRRSRHTKIIGAFVCHAGNPRARNEGPLRGIAVGIKDLIDSSDLPTEMGSPIYKGWQPRADV